MEPTHVDPLAQARLIVLKCLERDDRKGQLGHVATRSTIVPLAARPVETRPQTCATPLVRTSARAYVAVVCTLVACIGTFGWIVLRVCTSP
jgi:hypothetical protein